MRDARALAVVLAALVAVLVLGAGSMGAIMGGPMMGPGMMWGYGSQAGTPGIGGWGAALAMGLGWVMMLAFWGALVVGIVLLVRWAGGIAAHEHAQDDPLTVLQRRYAAGDIDGETYRRIRGELQRDRDSSTAEMRRAS